MAHKIAVVEDDSLIRDMVRLYLERQGYSIASFPSAESFLTEAGRETFDLLILDLVLPGMHGDSLLHELRRRRDNTPALILTVRDEVPVRLRAFNKGADDYMVKPFNLDELAARVRAITQRSLGRRQIPASDVIIIGGFRLNAATRQSESSQGEVLLSEKEVSLLLYLTRHARQNLSRADILEDVWGMHITPTPRTVDNFILRFRKLYERDPDKPRHFLSIRGLGYRYEP